jgi:hypothetical protein
MNDEHGKCPECDNDLVQMWVGGNTTPRRKEWKCPTCFGQKRVGMISDTERSITDPVPFSEVACLNGWPDGTAGHQMDEHLIRQVLALCDVYGYGRIGQLAGAIEEIWRDPASRKKWEDMRTERMNLLNEARVATGEVDV